MARRTPAPSIAPPPVPTAALLADTASRLLRWVKSTFGRLAAREVFGWFVNGRPHFAFGGPAANLARAFGFPSVRPLPSNRVRWLERSLARAFELPPDADVETQWDDRMGPGMVLEGIVDVVAHHVWHVEMETLTVTLLPEPGYPWFGPGTVYYAASLGRWVTPGPPPWQIEVRAPEHGDTGPGVRRPGADWCQLAARATRPQVTPAAVLQTKELALLVSHTVELHEGWAWRDAAASVARCGGLLFPSLAVGPIPGSNYGPCTLLADPAVVLRELKPYRVRGQLPEMRLYATDAFTPTTDKLVSEMAARLYDELTGRTNEETFLYHGTPHLLMLSPLDPEEEGEADGPAGNHAVLTVAQLVRAVRSRFRFWKGPLSLPVFQQKMASLQRDDLSYAMENFAYLEAKSTRIFPLDLFVAAYVPDFDAATYEHFLRALGYPGPVYVQPTTADERMAFLHRWDSRRGPAPDRWEEHARYNYAWKLAARAVAELPHRNMVT